jgi:hypothetical protein
VQLGIQRSLGPSARLALAMEMSDMARAFAEAGVRKRYPRIDDADVRRELIRGLYGVSPDSR